MTTKTGTEQLTWDLSDLYRGLDDPSLDADVAGALADAEGFKAAYEGRLADLSPAELAAAVAEAERIMSIMERADTYANLLYSTDTADPARGALVQKMAEQAARLRTELLPFRLEWIGLDDEGAEALLADPALERYRHYLAAQRRYRPYVLSQPEERILSEKQLTSRAGWVRLFTELVSSLRIDIDGEQISLEEALARLQQPDREVRRKAAEGVTAALRTGGRTRGFILNSLLLEKSTDDRLRGYPHWLAERNLSNEASDEAVEALVQAVVSRYDIPQRYYRLKARLLGLDRIADYDRVAPISTRTDQITWNEAKDLVLEAYRSFSPEAGKIISNFFERRWIHAAITPNKTPGAFCATLVPEVHPYVLMSFTGERRAALTLAHELGHGLHGVLAQDLGLLNADTPLTLAETASVFGEALTFKRLLAGEADPTARLQLLAGRIEDAITTVFRQVAMNRFEDAVHNARRNAGELSVDAVADKWIETQSAMLGDAVELTDGYRIWWSYIPHFIGSPGYVYAYAFGYLFSLAIFGKYEREGESMVEPYLELLRAGGSESPEALARIVGLDITEPRFWLDGLEGIDRLVSEAEALAP